jgi:Spy/CpxP family protein refolding chaperone
MRTRIAFLLVAICAAGWGQRGPGGRGERPEGPPATGLWSAPPGKWWDNPEMRAKLGITADQQKKMDDVFLLSRLKLIDLHAALEKEEVTLDPMIQGANLDDSKILPQIDRVVQARAELEKVHARLLLGIRHILTADQWTILEREQPRPPRPDRPPPPPPRK